MKISKIKINGMTNPVGYAFDSVRAAWLVTETEAKKADHVRIEAAEDPGFENIICTKEGSALDSAGEELEIRLKCRTRYYVRVSVRGDNGEEAVSEECAYFETAKREEPWLGSWIKPQPGDRFHPIFEKTFSARGDVTNARLYISGVGMYTAALNGEKVGNETLTPYFSDYHTEVQYQTYDVTDQIREDNTLCVELGNGWYKGAFGLSYTSGIYGSEYQMIAELHLKYADGSEDVIASDESWLYRGSDTEDGDGIYDGETINRLLWEGRDNPKRVPVSGGVEGSLTERYSVPVTEHESMPVRQVIHTPAGETVLDFGQNFAGYVQFHADLPKGTRVVLDFGEILQQGNFYRENYRRAKSQFVYVSGGREEIVKPRFTFFGFRYVRVSGWDGEVDPEDFCGKALYSEMEETGFFVTGHENVNRLFSNAKWGQKSNSIDFPTDCPQRDERLGWTGDAQVFSGAASYNMNTAAFYNKFLHDLRTEQVKLDGILPGVIPVLDPENVAYAAVWGDIAAFLPTVLYERFADKKALEAYYPMMKDWVDRIDRDDSARGHHYLFNFNAQMGDWLALDGRSEQSMKGGTDDYFIASCYYSMSAKMVSDAAGALGYTEDRAHYGALSGKIRRAVLREYFTESGKLAVDTQTGYITALYSGIYREKERLVEDFRTRLYKDCYKLKGGFVGAPLMCRVMAENGMEQEALYFLTQEGYPGWMHCIGLGATTIWERWNSVLEDGTMSGTMMNSLNHFAFGAVVEYLYRDVAGLKALEPGFRKASIAPQISKKLGFARLSYDSVYGTFRSEWKIQKDGSVNILVEVPFGCSAEVELPYAPALDKEVFEVGAGVHEYTYQPTKNMNALYDKKTLFVEMVDDERAMEAIGRHTPFLKLLLDQRDEEFLHESLTGLRELFYMGFAEEQVDSLAEELLRLEG